MAAVYWLILFVALAGIEALTVALTTIWFAGGALAAFFCALAGAGVEAQLVVFVAVSFILLIFTRPFAIKYINRNTEKTNVESLEGKKARVTSDVDNDAGTGTAVVGGQEWTARSADPKKTFKTGEIVRIVEVRGVKLMIDKEDSRRE
ncbi:MAG TPA: NfeD family protein [Candidatus Lachnoclostridium stercoravium]|uniref:NfeD family protein n=1 Tax=Candidatus Lachnoclostridium stercoravium TaxID=2838633 RepID=A0A9D2HGD6_9FIRM|nr:NfeD family protein [Candidatus Lachnoclostridium stercoravium]